MLETLCVVWSILKLRVYLRNQPFTVYSDSNAVRGILNSPRPTPMIARWIAALSEFDFEVKHRPGKSNANADFLSRLGE